MFRFKIVLILCCLSGCAQAQGYFNKLNPYPRNADSWLFDYSAIIAEDNYFYCLGSKLTAVNSVLTISKLNEQGDTLWNKVIGESPFVYNPARFVEVENNFYVGCYIKDNASDTVLPDFAIIKINREAEVIWQKRYVKSGQDVPSQILATMDGGFVLAGTTGSFGDVTGDFYLIKTDSLGNLEWEKTYGGIKTDVANSVALTSDGGYILTGYSSSYSASTDCLVIKTDSLGNELWAKNFGLAFNDNGGMVTELNDKTFLVSTAFRTSSSQLDATLLKLDIDGQIIWQQTYTESNYSSLGIPIIENDDGTIIVGGIIMNSLNNPVGKILKVDPSGNQLWSRKYFTRSDRPNYINQIAHTSNNSMIFCGAAFDSMDVKRAWVAKLDCFGCDSLLCYYEDSICEPFVSVPEIQLSVHIPKLYPNPIEEVSKLVFQNVEQQNYTLKIYNALGKIIMQKETTNDYFELNNSDFVSGIYNYVLLDMQQGLVKSGKFSSF